MKRKQKEPNKPNDPRKKSRMANPIAVRPYFKGNKRVAGYKRRRAGDGDSDER